MLKTMMVGMAIAGLVLSLAGPGECKPVDYMALGDQINVKLDKDKNGKLNGFDWAKMSSAERTANATLIATYFYAKFKAYKSKSLDLSVKADKQVVDAQAAKIVKQLNKDYLMPYTRRTDLYDSALRAFTENHTKYNQ